ncbi:MAG: carbamoyltransferase HypF [Clostridia bacterium]|nr:carbamoyltransferase HypF [Clostridia bacterium]
MDNGIITERICVYGIVQGVGFRPFVSRAADRAGVRGSVCNRGSYVEIFAQGTRAEIDGLMHSLQHEAPERSAILKIDERPYDSDVVYERFDIVDSAREKGAIFVSPDIAICPKCKSELYDRNDRRYLHPFINCTACGPRLTILDSMPYDRERTSMGEFPMCPKCNYEYITPETRRYDAQPVCCNDCGPEVYIVGTDISGREAITAARKKIREGGIIAIKGIGGFHLCCDATNEIAVMRLRKLKPRPSKPFAVMAKDLDTARREAVITPEQEEILDGHQKPIILLEKCAGGKLAPSIAPDNPKVGIMLPYAPVQLLLFDYDDGLEMPDVFVMTSANVSGAPIVRDDETALKEISHMVDMILSNNRKIRMRADDTVMDFYDGKPYMIRRSRGYAPLPFMLDDSLKGTTLGIGGELKNTFCLSFDNLFYPSPYVGDMADVRTVRALEETVERMSQLLEIRPEIIACDLHPRYNTVVVAESLAKEWDVPLIRIQHHYAHVLSCMAENEYLEPVIGVSFDGTGYGTDGTIWGGEILRASCTGFERLGHIAGFPQAGGDLSAKEGWRIAAGMIHRIEKDMSVGQKIAEKLKLCSSEEFDLIGRMIDHNINTITSTSAGRLFDAVSAILGIRRTSSFEGEASMTLQFAAERYAAENGMIPGAGSLPDGIINMNEGSIVLPSGDIVRDMIESRLSGVQPDVLAWKFHNVLAAEIVEACRRASEITGLRTVALTGGVFQNRVLLAICDSQLKRDGFKVLKHSMLPANDGGIALGQALAAAVHLQKMK